MPSHPPPERMGGDGPGWWFAILLALIIVGAFVLLVGCAPAYSETRVVEASLPEAIADVQVYDDPGGCQYLVFTSKSNGSAQIAVRQAPNTNGMCKASQ